jgi:hypothetical protein
VRWADRGRYEFDHLVPRELGGADDVRTCGRNRWPKRASKIIVRMRLHRAVCAGTITLTAAQAEMRAWGRP